jgi:hypothetical protein
VKVVAAVNERIEYWIDLADYDIETAKAMLKSKRFLYVGLMCHQAIEKALKAIIVRDCQIDEIPPKIHDLSKLAVVILEAMAPIRHHAGAPHGRTPQYRWRILSGRDKTVPKCPIYFYLITVNFVVTK